MSDTAPYPPSSSSPPNPGASRRAPMLDDSTRAGDPAVCGEPAGAPGEATDIPLRDMVAEALDLLEREGEDALDAFLRRHPEQADALRARLQSLRAYGLTEGSRVPDRLAGFRLLRRLGGGGMGVVYVAEQEGLGRHVALKIVRPETLYFAGARERFRRELDALGRLQHPGIVPVFAGGEHEGVPYLAMELVRGASLAEALVELSSHAPARLTGKDLHGAVSALVARKGVTGPTRASSTQGADPADPADPAPTRHGTSAGVRGSTSATGPVLAPLYAGTWTQVCFRIARAVAEALQHAHGQGVLHRDIKPSNIMLTPDGRVLLLDFGLATAHGSAKLTGTGQALGSPAYMSPEQMRGDPSAVDERSDVYALGVTLYEALTLQHPYASDSLDETRRRVLAASPVPPRAWAPQLPRDAETVVLVAMDKDPPRRYASTQEFLGDLTAVLERRPVSARRPGAGLRARRWIQRHPAAAVLLAAGLLLVVGGPVAYALQQRAENARQRDSNERIRAALVESERQREAAHRHFERAERAVDVLLTQVAEEDLLDVPHLEPVRRRLLESALSFYEELLAERTDDPSLGRKVAAAAFRSGFLLAELGRMDEALLAFDRQLALVDEAARAAGPDALDDAWRALRQDALHGRAMSLAFQGRFAEAARASDEALAVQRARGVDALQERSALVALDDILSGRAFIASATGDTATASKTYREMVETSMALIERSEGDERALRHVSDAVIALGNLAGVLDGMGRVAEAEQSVAQAIDLMLPNRDALMTTPSGAFAVASALLQLGVRLEYARQDADAEDVLQEAVSVLAEAVTRRPNHAELRRLLASASNRLGLLLLEDASRLDAARAALESAADEGRSAVEHGPHVPLYRANLAMTLTNLGALERQLGQLDAAVRRLEDADTLLADVTQAVPGQAAWRAARRMTLWHLGLVHLDRAARGGVAAKDAAGDDVAARNDVAAAADDATAVAERMAAALPDDGEALRVAAGLMARASALDARGERVDAMHARALVLLRSAVDAGFTDIDNLDTAQDLAALRERPEFAAVRAAAAQR